MQGINWIVTGKLVYGSRCLFKSVEIKKKGRIRRIDGFRKEGVWDLRLCRDKLWARDPLSDCYIQFSYVKDLILNYRISQKLDIWM